MEITVCLFPDFHSRAMVVSHPVCVVVELICKPVFFRLFSDKLVDGFDCPIGSQMSWRELYFCPHGLKYLYPLLANRLGHGEEDTVPFH